MTAHLGEAVRLGLDIGSVTLKAAVLSSGGDLRWRAAEATHGRPLRAALALLHRLADELGPGQTVRAAITGSSRAVLEGIEGLCAMGDAAATARAVHRGFPTARQVVDLGGQVSRWMALNSEGRVTDFATNGLCAAGSGAFLEQQAGRLDMEVEQLGQLAAQAKQAVTVAGRCAVFAKSDMIHLQQKGTPPDEIALGLCRALVRTFLGTVLANRTVKPPLVLVGGGAANPGLVRAFAEELSLTVGESLLLPDDPLGVGAYGAALLAKQSPSWTIDQLCSALQRQPPSSAPAATGSGLGPLPAVRAVAPTTGDDSATPLVGPQRAFVGVDVGSVSTNLVLTNEHGASLCGVYLRTRGRPVEVLNEGLSRLNQRCPDGLTVLGVGSTGSGRHLAARVLGADVVHNEITAQLTSTVRHFPDADTIFEIGGQDSKYIALERGALADFEMNKICAAGTGSFLEEQAERLGVAIKGEFGRLALTAKAPPDLGTRCTVFMDAELVRFQAAGSEVGELCAGLAYSVARNYLERVVAGRPVGQKVVFQGGTASNRAVVAAFCAILGRDVEVHPHNRLSGALGAAMLAIEAKQRGDYHQSNFAGLDACAEPRISSFDCPRCDNRCRVNRIAVRNGTVVHFGDACERYAERDRRRPAAQRPFGELFAARRSLLSLYTTVDRRSSDRREVVGLPRAGLALEYMPLWTTVLDELGFRPHMAPPTTGRLMERHSPPLPGEVCLPVKVIGAQVQALLQNPAVDRVLVPPLLECLPDGDDGVTNACLYNQQIGDALLASTPHERLIRCPKFALRDEAPDILEPARALAEALGRSPAATARALRHGVARQRSFANALLALGRQALASRFDRAVVVMGKPYNLHDPYLNLSLARLLDRAGLWAIPAEMLPLAEVELSDRWSTVAWHFNRQQLKTVEFLRRDRRLYPLHVSSYGCGPDGFTLKHLDDLLGHRPRLFLEFDEHRGEAGLVTRIEAFCDAIDQDRRSAATPVAPRPAAPATRPTPAGKRVFVPNVGHPAPIYAAAFRSLGIDGQVLPMPDAETVRLGEEASNGRECHPYTIFGGEMLRWIKRDGARPGDVFMSPVCETPCMMRMYGDGYRALLRRRGLDEVEVWDTRSTDLVRVLGVPGTFRMHRALMVADLLFTLTSRLRPYEREPGRVDRMFEDSVQRLARLMETKRDCLDELPCMVDALWAVPRHGEPGDRPVVGVSGDAYTRLHSFGNAGLFSALELAGCEVWPSPYFAEMVNFSAREEIALFGGKGRLRRAAWEVFVFAMVSRVRHSVLGPLSARVRALCGEPPPATLSRKAAPFVSKRTNYLISHVVGKLADFLDRGAAGAISAVGLNCMVGTAVAAALPALRRAYPGAALLDLAYGGNEAASQRVRLETFVHQVKSRSV